MTNYALNNLIEIFRQIQVGHEQLNDFYFGDVANLGGDKLYPLLLVDIDSTQFSDNQTKFRFNCFVLDKLQQNFDNANEVYSDTLRVQEDIFAFLERNREYEFAINPDAELERVLSDINSDFVAGWNMKIEIDVPFGGDICSIPGLVTSTPAFESSTSSSSPMFLTCENLSSCSTFTNLLGTKTNISGATFTGNIYAPVISGGTFFSGGTDLATIIGLLSTADGNDITRVQPGLNIYTGGTANNPTLNISAATLSFLSASTISAQTIHVTNLQGFSPINLNDSLQVNTDVSIKAQLNTNQIDLDNSSFNGAILISDDNGQATGQYLLIDSNSGQFIIKGNYLDIQGSTVRQTVQGNGTLEAIVGGAYVYRAGGIGQLAITAGGSASTLMISTIQSQNNAGVFNSVIAGGRFITADTSNTLFAPNARLAETAGSRIYSAGTDLYNIFSTSTGDVTRVQPGLNTYTGGTNNFPTVNVSGGTFDYVSATTLYAGQFVLTAPNGSTWEIGVTNAGAISTTQLTPPLSIPLAGLLMWLDANDSGSLFVNDNGTGGQPSNGGTVGRWTDLSGNGNDIFQATSGNRPTYNTNSINGLPVITFDGVDDYLIATSFAWVRSSTVFVVVKRLTTTGSIFDGNGGNTGRFYSVGGTSMQVYGDSGAVSIPASAYTIVKVTMETGAQDTMTVDNGTQVVTSTFNNGNWNGFILGDTAFTGDPSKIEVAEVIGYDRLLTSGEDGIVWSYLSDKYNITI